jgi:hypothetical protein
MFSRQPVIPPAPLTGDVGRGCGDASCALLSFSSYFFVFCEIASVQSIQKKSGTRSSVPDFLLSDFSFDQEAAARGARLREFRWKNSAWLATADTIAGWNGFEIRNAGSGRSPVRKRSG